MRLEQRLTNSVGAGAEAGVLGAGLAEETLLAPVDENRVVDLAAGTERQAEKEWEAATGADAAGRRVRGVDLTEEVLVGRALVLEGEGGDVAALTLADKGLIGRVTGTSTDSGGSVVGLADEDVLALVGLAADLACGTGTLGNRHGHLRDGQGADAFLGVGGADRLADEALLAVGVDEDIVANLAARTPGDMTGLDDGMTGQIVVRADGESGSVVTDH
ncbi:hypothetical protein BDK51DRAFT_42792 [Blyttiomyces helicus]|uniref:Uncharacterized protein n=1 Tax=Blyttiomyces helicus TaxID=388810 RepID=A0A4V1IRK2_9FUNG|nr:hypothetical protein BDK51DRAFT_42792 [Blyttiomyces helicus]|eukprot:RKO90347.1 hypothetical protein BDK51DRAFT_42792 [Blyttiomyces helicus]